MGVGWIDNIFNNTDRHWFFQSVDDRNNGALSGGSSNFTLDDRAYHKLSPHTHYTADWCGIPWYYSGKHYKVISPDEHDGVKFYTSQNGAKNCIVYEELQTGRQRILQHVPGGDFHCNLRIENEGFFIDVVNNHEFSSDNALYLILGKTEEWLKYLAPEVIKAFSSMVRTKSKEEE